MDYLKIDNVVVDLALNPDFAVFESKIFDGVPVDEPVAPYITIVPISDPPVSPVSNRARIEVRLVLEQGTTAYNARLWYKKLDDFFVGMKVFGGEEVYNIHVEDRRNFIDDRGNMIILVDYYFDYLV